MNEDKRQEIKDLATLLTEARGELKTATEAYNEAAKELGESLWGVLSGIEEHFADQPERWQLSEMGIDLGHTMAEWGQLASELDCDIEVPEEVDVLGLPGL